MPCCGMMRIHRSLKWKKRLMVTCVGALVIDQFLTRHILLVRQESAAGIEPRVGEDVVWRMVI